MEIRMEHTDGLGEEAEVLVGGHLLKVCDGVSSALRPCPPGVLEGVKFSYVCMAGHGWDGAVRRNPSRRKALEPQKAWGYVGYGQVVQVMPVVIDFGLIEMEDALWSSDETLVGQYVGVAIDRLEISPAHKPDWPKHIR